MKNELFHKLYESYSTQVFSYLFGRTSSKDIAADLLQDVFLRIWNRMVVVERISDEQRLYWIFSIASNRVKDFYRKSSHQKKAEEKMRCLNNQIPAGDLSQLLVGRERFSELEAAISSLPEELRCILLMKVIGEMNSSQIGDALCMPAGTIRYRIARARHLLAQNLKLLETEAAAGRSRPNG
jgi:RNA polymerase sigma factor (sigma-70 family)